MKLSSSGAFIDADGDSGDDLVSVEGDLDANLEAVLGVLQLNSVATSNLTPPWPSPFRALCMETRMDRPMQEASALFGRTWGSVQLIPDVLQVINDVLVIAARSVT